MSGPHYASLSNSRLSRSRSAWCLRRLPSRSTSTSLAEAVFWSLASSTAIKVRCWAIFASPWAIYASVSHRSCLSVCMLFMRRSLSRLARPRPQSSPLSLWPQQKHHSSLEMVHLSAEAVPLPLERFERLKELREQFSIGGWCRGLRFGAWLSPPVAWRCLPRRMQHQPQLAPLVP